ncbi:hypothetical protein AB0F10_44845, partial [Actinoplanes sp. NPDC026623]
AGPGPLAEFDGVRVGERLRLPGLLALAPGQRLLVTGENGAGKTTRSPRTPGRWSWCRTTATSGNASTATGWS